MNQVKGILFEGPVGFCIVYLKLYVWWNPLYRPNANSVSDKRTRGEGYNIGGVGLPCGLNRGKICTDDFSGWVSSVKELVFTPTTPILRSTEVEIRKGEGGLAYSPASMAHIPVPVPMSRIFCGFGSIGARWSLSSNTIK